MDNMEKMMQQIVQMLTKLQASQNDNLARMEAKMDSNQKKAEADGKAYKEMLVEMKATADADREERKADQEKMAADRKAN
jgi:hypothetical protein